MADLTITAANVVAGANAVRENGTAGEAITAGQVVYKSSATNKYMLADCDSATAEARLATGIALNGAALNQPLQVLKSGDITIGATLDPDEPAYYLSDTAGAICPVGDMESGDYFCLIGLAKSATVLAVNIHASGVAHTA